MLWGVARSAVRFGSVFRMTRQMWAGGSLGKSVPWYGFGKSDLPNPPSYSHGSLGMTPDCGCGASFRRSAGGGKLVLGAAPEMRRTGVGGWLGVVAPSAAGAGDCPKNRPAPFSDYEI